MNNIQTREERFNLGTVLNTLKIFNYVINNDGTVDVNQSIYIHSNSLTEIPVQFGIVHGDFQWIYSSLTTLKGAPSEVTGNFTCHSNHITSLEGCPNKVGGNFDVNNNRLVNLKHCSQYIGSNFDCSSNPITSLEHCPKNLSESFSCENTHITSLEFLPSTIKRLYYQKTLLPLKVINTLNIISREEESIYYKYQHQVEVWDDVFDEEAFDVLIEEIKDGLL